MLRSIVAVAGAALLSATAAHAMTEREVVKAHIPFAFRVEGVRMPAGDYRLKPMDITLPAVYEIRRTDARGPAAVFLTIPKPSGSITRAQMVFDDVGKQKFLRAVLLPGENGIELPVVRAEVRAARKVAVAAKS